MSADAEHQKDIFVLIEHLQGQVSDISYVMLAAGRAVAEGTGGNVVALLLGHEVQGLASDLAADQLWYIDHPSLAHHTPEAYQQVVTNLIQANAPRLALFGDTSIGAEAACTPKMARSNSSAKSAVARSWLKAPCPVQPPW
jgi:electron transfer flavoprotein alpha subunit